MRQVPVCVFGEVLFDLFPDGHRVLGGAPFNVAWHLNAFGERPYFCSAVGDDEPGQRVREAMVDWGMDSSGLRTDPDHPTGEVAITLTGGEPSYDILPDRAYDHLHELPGALRCDLLYHGTLALRGAVSAKALDAIKSGEPKQVFLDVNLRDPWWNRNQVLDLVAGADWVKLNRDELELLSEGGSRTGDDLAARAARFREAHGLTGVILTLGAGGALGVTAADAGVRVAPPADIAVVDTVGAGDAFAAVSILGIRHGWPLAETLSRAQLFAARIVAQRGATAAAPALYEPFIDRWGLAPEP